MTETEKNTTEMIPEAETALPSFNEMPLTQDVKDALADMGYKHPAPVQHAVYEAAVRGKDLVVQARTGTGKTAAFGIPLIDQIVKRSQANVQALVLTPTRELAVQVTKELDRIASKRGVKVAAIYGGAPMQRQIDAIKGGAQIVVGTPGRVLDHLRRGTLEADAITTFVLDESDEMLSMGFEKDMRAIEAFLPESHQTLLFSATLPSDILRMVSDRLEEPEFIYLSGDHVGALEILHYVYFVNTDKAGALTRIIEVEDPESALVFCNTKDQTEAVAGALVRAGYDADWLNGDMSQSERERVMSESKEGKLRFLVATDVAARGIDISHLTHVINFDFPDSAETYVHRTGRTGRMGRTGTAISLVTAQDIGAMYYLRLTYKIRPFEKRLPSAGEVKTRLETDIIDMLVEGLLRREPHPDDVSLARRLMTHERADHLIAALLRNHLGEREEVEEQASAARRSRRPRRPPRRSRKERTSGDSVRGVHRTAGEKASSPSEPNEERKNGRRRQRSRGPLGDGSTKTLSASAPTVVNASESVPKRAVQAAVAEQSAPPEKIDLGLPSFREEPMTEEDIAFAKQAAAKKTQRRASAVDSKAGDEMSSPSAAGSSANPDDSHASPEQSPVEATADQPSAPEQSQDLTNEDESVSPDTDKPAEVELFVNVGRRDGVRAGDFVQLLADADGVTRDDVGRIRVRDRNSFVSVRGSVLALAVKALDGATIGDRVVKAEVARPRSPEGSARR